MTKKSTKTPNGKLVEIDGITYQVIDGKLYRYADLTFDKGFKIVLGRIGSEEVLRHLLNRLLGTSIVHLEYRNTEHHGLTEEERSSRFDVYCEDENGSCFQVEMQNWSQLSKPFDKLAYTKCGIIKSSHKTPIDNHRVMRLLLKSTFDNFSQDFSAFP